MLCKISIKTLTSLREGLIDIELSHEGVTKKVASISNDMTCLSHLKTHIISKVKIENYL